LAKRGRPKKIEMPDSAEPSNAKNWLRCIDRAKKVRQNWRDRMRVSLAYDYFEGIQRPAGINEKEWITINMIYSNLLAELPTLYSTDPYFYVKLKKSFKPVPETIAAYEEMAKVRQGGLNYYKGELGLKEKSRLAISDAFFQYGVIEVALSADMEENPKKGEAILGEDGRPMLDEDDAPLLEPEEVPANEAFQLIRHHPDDFLVDADAGPLDDDVKWKAKRVKMRLEEVRDDRRFDRSARRDCKATEMDDQTDKEREARKKGGTLSAQQEKTPSIVVTWWLYDRCCKQFLVVAEGNDDYLIAPKDIPKGIEKDPFVDLRFTPRSDSWYPIPPISQQIDPQREYCETRSKMLKHRKRFNRKYVMFTTPFGDNAESEAAKLENGDDGAVLMATTPTGFAPVMPIQDAPLDQNIHVEYAYLRKDFEDVATGANQRGSAQGVDSATEAGVIEKRTQIREGDRIGMVGDFVIGIGRKLDQMIQAHWKKEQAVKIVGPQGEEWITMRPQDYEKIEGEYEYSINVGATTPQLPEIERAQWLSFLGVVTNAPQLLLSKTLLKETARMHHIESDALVEELFTIGQQMMSGEIPMPGAQGSQPNTQGTAAARTGGQAAGSNNVMSMRGGPR